VKRDRLDFPFLLTGQTFFSFEKRKTSLNDTFTIQLPAKEGGRFFKRRKKSSCEIQKREKKKNNQGA